MASLRIILQKVQPTILALCETKLSKNSHGLLEETLGTKLYKIIPRYTKAGKEGLVIAVKNNTFRTVLDVTNSQLKTIISVRLSTGTYNIRVILGYAPQEDEDETIREEFFDELELEIKLCIQSGDIPLLVGDFNAKIQASDSPQGIPVSKNGTLFYNVLQEHDLQLLNFDNICSGKWTHVIRTTNASSIIDYVATDNSLKTCIKSMIIDETMTICPFRVTKRKGNQLQTFSDHNPILLNLDVPRSKITRKEYIPKWIIKPEGYKKMVNLFNEYSDAITIDPNNTQQTYNQFENMLHNTLDQCFKKTTNPEYNNKSFKDSVHKIYKPICKILTKFATKGKIQRKVAAEYRARIIQMNTDRVSSLNAQRLLERVMSLSQNDKFSAQNFWKAKKSIQGSLQSYNSVYNEKGTEVFG